MPREPWPQEKLCGSIPYSSQENSVIAGLRAHEHSFLEGTKGSKADPSLGNRQAHLYVTAITILCDGGGCPAGAQPVFCTHRWFRRGRISHF
jgi:hypothetical protein